MSRIKKLRKKTSRKREQKEAQVGQNPRRPEPPTRSEGKLHVVQIRSIICKEKTITYPSSPDELWFYLSDYGYRWMRGHTRDEIQPLEIVANTANGIVRRILSAVIRIAQLCDPPGIALVFPLWNNATFVRRNDEIGNGLSFRCSVVFTTKNWRIDRRDANFLPEFIEVSDRRLAELQAEDHVEEIHSA